jgi:hypothetical protein
VAGKSVDRSILQGESIELFRAAIKSPATRDPYERRLIHFLKIMKLAPELRRVVEKYLSSKE